MIGEKMAEYELMDIDEEGYACVFKDKPFFDDILIDNVKEVLEKQAGFKRCDVYIPAGAYTNIGYNKIEDDTGMGYYEYDWNAICELPNGKKKELRGVAYGNLSFDLEEAKKFNDPCKERYTLLDMTVETGGE